MKITDLMVEEFSWLRNKPIRNGLHVYTHSVLPSYEYPQIKALRVLALAPQVR